MKILHVTQIAVVAAVIAISVKCMFDQIDRGKGTTIAEKIWYNGFANVQEAQNYRAKNETLFELRHLAEALVVYTALKGIFPDFQKDIVRERHGIILKDLNRGLKNLRTITY
jgi:hypothetical protein